MVGDPIEDLGAQLIRHLLLGEHLTSGGDMVDPEADGLAVEEAKVEVERAAHERLEVSDVLVAAHVHVLLEVEVGDEDKGAVEVVGGRDVLFLQRRRLLEPGHSTDGRAVAQRLEDIQRVLVQEDAVSVVQHHHVAGLAIAPAELIQIDSAEATLHDFELGVGGVFEHLLDRVRLADTGGTRHDQRADVGTERGLGQLVQHAEAVLEVAEDLGVRALNLDLGLGAGGDVCMAGATALLDFEHCFSLCEVDD